MTDDMARVLRKVKEFEFKNGWLGEYVFQDDRGRVYASRISDCAVNNTTTAEFHNKKSIHAVRRTFTSYETTVTKIVRKVNVSNR